MVDRILDRLFEITMLSICLIGMFGLFIVVPISMLLTTMAPCQ